MRKYFLLGVAFPLITFFLFVFAGESHQKKAKWYKVPFCGFNLKNGYFGEQENVKQFITHEAHRGDKSGIPDVVYEIKKQFQINPNITIFIAKDEENCFATILDGRRVLIVDHLFLNKVNKDAATQWAAISILAHEIGHHIAGFNRHESPLDDELDADYWCGFALRRLGAGKNASIKCITKYGSEQDSDTHPNKYKRIEMIQKGWEDANNGKIDYSKCGNCKN